MIESEISDTTRRPSMSELQEPGRDDACGGRTSIFKSGSPFSNRLYRYIAGGALVVFAVVWHMRATGRFSWITVASFALYVWLCLIYGRTFILATRHLALSKAGLSYQFLGGFFAFNTLLFALALISPLGMVVNISLLTAVALGLDAFTGRLVGKTIDRCDELPSLLCILLAGTATTLWCFEAQVPLLSDGSEIVWRTWRDAFIHARQISVFSQAHGLATIQELNMAGTAARIYHFASYLPAAAIAVMTSSTAVESYSAVQLPLGILLTGLAAFTLVACMWGPWPAFAASAALLLLPDAYQQGFANRYLSYNFLAQANLGMLYGLACAALAWTFIFDGCSRGSYRAILVGYFFLSLCLTYKAHIFVASAFVALLFTCLFFSGLRAGRRIIFTLACTAVFAAVIAWSQGMDRVPVMRLDGSGAAWYVMQLLKDYDDGAIKEFFSRVLVRERHSMIVDGLYAVALLSLSTFGLWLLAVAAVAILAKKRISPALLWFPLIILVNYFVMSLGLAIDTRGHGTPDELLNRPLVWAYFCVVCWSVGGAYYLAFGAHAPPTRRQGVVLLALVTCGVAGPLIFGPNLQTFPTRKGHESYEKFNAIPRCLFKAAQFIRQHGSQGDIVQDSENDPRFILSALTERQLFASATLFGGRVSGHQERLESLRDFKLVRSAGEWRSYLALHRIDWYLLHPQSAVAWPEGIFRNVAFACDGYRVFRASD